MAGFAGGDVVLFACFAKTLHNVQRFCKTSSNLPPCRRRHALPGQDRVTPVFEPTFREKEKNRVNHPV